MLGTFSNGYFEEQGGNRNLCSDRFVIIAISQRDEYVFIRKNKKALLFFIS